MKPILFVALLAAGWATLALAAPLPDWTTRHQRDHPLVGQIWSVADDGFVTPEALVEDLARADQVLLGEIHDNADHHRLQAWTIAALAEAGRRPAVVFEMIPADLAPALDAYLAANPDDAEGLGAALDWQARGWPAWAIYAPVAQAAMDAGLALRAGDLDTALRKRIGGEGLSALAEGEAARLALAAPLPPERDELLRQDLRDGHCGLLPEAAVGAIFQVQRARDAALADAMLAAGETSVLIAGAGHSRNDIAVPWYLAARNPDATVRSVAFVEADPEREAPSDYLPAPGAFDYLWFTPRGSQKDHCAALRERFGKKPAE